MGISNKFLAALALVCALAIAPIAYSATALTVTSTPSHVKVGKNVAMKIVGLKPGEKVKAVETIPSTGQKRTLYPKQKASAGGVVINTVRAQVKGKHVWAYTGRTSHRKGSTHYVVK